MKFTLSWLKEHLDTDATLDQIDEALTRVGLEVEGIENPGEKLAAFRVAKVLTAERHPQADKLQVLTIDAGDGVPLQVVCGAPNARAGLVGVLGLPGAVVPANGMVLKVAAVRGVESNGMMCSTRELELGEDHDGIIELPEDAPIGTSFPDYAGLNDPVFDVSITPNRQDCMGVRGIARDLAAAGLGTLKPLDATPVKGQGAGPEVRIDAHEGCPAYYGQTVRGVTNGASPDWMQARLKAVGQRPISALVDITNYVMIDLGRPLHVYDKAKLSGALVVRKAKAGEQVLALNEKTYTLDESITVIADDNGVHDIGGIMGGEDTGVSETTTDVVIECAYFDPEHIARAGQKLLLTSDARTRFERGVDPAFLEDGIAIATRLVTQICGGSASEVTRVGTLPRVGITTGYDPVLAETLGGLAIPAGRQKAILESLGFTVEPLDANGDPVGIDAGFDAFRVTAPSWRRDIDGPADLVEEVIRIEGIDNVPSTPLPRAPGVATPTATPEQKLERRMRRTAASRGLNEAVTWSFIAEKEAAAVGGGAWTLANPISEDLKVMRPSLLPGLLMAAGRNTKRGATSVRLFEIGRRYLADAEKPTLTALLAGDKTPRGWANGKAQPFTAYDAKAEALALLEAAGAPVGNLQVMGEAGDAWHPGQSATLRLGPKTVLAAFGMLHPALLKQFDLDGPVAAVEIFLDAIPAKRSTGFMRPAYTPPALQAVTRDFAFIVPAELAAGDLVRAVRGADKAVITDARLFDLFTGAGVEDGKKSLAVEVTLQPGEKSFTDAEIKAVADKVVAAAAKLGATLRG
ncbi:phenylalanine--tRNA ligase subunit beta [Sphingomonas koreensis]|jgi:phenylalanyl-tRNA synthetase beta chain|uniref:Phenylalanine--tRNA ligase beta subunit n=1 Tax=Sphingomonas koreensis TaxID=93064 RepID=A0A1L6J7M6_9SPHN|nr:phenylalanine--tRNA ligase subunit beta [Sphingomonas koreensis]APR51530.1 phenylalanine--tRNA ligase subunit beta [Sphingomonas koreensis]MDC7812762.1 phenylalanine--tRNA ligase subunit beta [Sphingomonas koreensis]RSU22582.1 phenylalanine--tRNA ligase subunit beta [Sphingomonas koreensis]RSU27611.1 phenylalanine--tRNA ligase subunit beta [Sphingomonas koreensis]RSU29120.1 phenylalanine--tRNA ligase subunit beta [Sphingomonas koreensis]